MWFKCIFRGHECLCFFAELLKSVIEPNRMPDMMALQSSPVSWVDRGSPPCAILRSNASFPTVQSQIADIVTRMLGAMAWLPP